MPRQNHSRKLSGVVISLKNFKHALRRSLVRRMLFWNVVIYGIKYSLWIKGFVWRGFYWGKVRRIATFYVLHYSTWEKFKIIIRAFESALKLALHFENARRVLGQIRVPISIHITKNIFSHVGYALSKFGSSRNLVERKLILRIVLSENWKLSLSRRTFSKSNDTPHL